MSFYASFDFNETDNMFVMFNLILADDTTKYGVYNW